MRASGKLGRLFAQPREHRGLAERGTEEIVVQTVVDRDGARGQFDVHPFQCRGEKGRVLELLPPFFRASPERPPAEGAHDRLHAPGVCIVEHAVAGLRQKLIQDPRDRFGRRVAQMRPTCSRPRAAPRDRRIGEC